MEHTFLWWSLWFIFNPGKFGCSFRKTEAQIKRPWTSAAGSGVNQTAGAQHWLSVVLIQQYVRWPRELNALQLQTTHANRKSTSKSRKHFHRFDSKWWKCSQHKQIHFISTAFLFWLCCEHLQHVCCQIEEVVFLICRCSFSIWSALSSLGHRKYVPFPLGKLKN